MSYPNQPENDGYVEMTAETYSASRKEMIKQVHSLPMLKLDIGVAVYVDCTDDLEITMLQSCSDNIKGSDGENGYDALVVIDQPSRGMNNEHMLMVSSDYSDFVEDYYG